MGWDEKADVLCASWPARSFAVGRKLPWHYYQIIAVENGLAMLTRRGGLAHGWTVDKKITTFTLAARAGSR